MVRLAANLSMMYQEYEFLDRFAAAARDGFTGVEYLFPYEYPTAVLREQLDQHGLEQVLFNAPPGNWDAGERGIASLPGREAEFRTGIVKALHYAHELNCAKVHVMAGLAIPGSRRSQDACYRENLTWAAELAHQEGVRLLIEPINRRDMPDYYLATQRQAQLLVSEIDQINLGVQLDLYHCQITEGDLTLTLETGVLAGHVAHIQIAGVPRRQEPDTGEVDYAHLLRRLDELSYQGAVGLEYRPAAGTSAGVTRVLQHFRERGVSL